MRARTCALLLRLLIAAPLLGLGGCQNNQQTHRDIYLRELRLQEDEIYRLEDCIQEYQGIIREYRVEMDQLKRQAVDSPTGGGSSRLAPVPNPPRSVLDDPASDASPGLRRLDEPLEDDTPDIDVPSIDLGEPMPAPRASVPPAIDPPPLDSQPLEPAPGAAAPESVPPIDIPPLDVPAAEPRPTPQPDSRYGPAEDLPPLSRAGNAAAADQASDVLRLPADPLGGLAVDGYAGPNLETGEATLVTLVRPRTLLGEPTQFLGQASVMLMDPSVGADGEKLARWDFSAEEVALSWRPDTDEPVLDLAVVLPANVPQDRELELWVRLVDQPHDQRVLEQSVVVLERLASIEQATLASAAADEPHAGEPPVEETATSLADEGWRASERAAIAAASGSAADSGWRQSDQAPEPSKLRLATHEAAPLPAPPAPKEAAPLGGPLEWSPTR